MKRRALVGLLALTGSVAVVGSGFASWYFGSQDLTANPGVGIYTTVLAENIGKLTQSALPEGDETVGEIGEKAFIWLVADQAGYNKKDDKTLGLSFCCTDTNTIGEDVNDDDSSLGFSIKSLTATYSISENDYLALAHANLKGTFTATLEIKEAAQTYIQFVDGYKSITSTYDSNTTTTSTATGKISATTTKIEYTFDVDYSKISKGDYSQTFTIDVSSDANDKNALLQYVSKPTNKTSYEAMKTAFKNGALDINYKFAVSVNE